MTTLNTLNNIALAGLGGWVRPLLSSATIPFSQAGRVRIIGLGAAGSGAAVANILGRSGTGANSAPWGCKVFSVQAGQSLVCTLPAGAARPAALDNNGVNGGTSSYVLDGTTLMTVAGSEGGAFGSGAGTFNTPVPTAAVTGADWWVPGVRAGSATNNGNQIALSGGAAVDILQTGKGRSPNVNGTGGIGGSVGSDTGMLLTPWLIFLDFLFYAGNGVGTPGQAGGTNSGEIAGAFAGGGSGTTSADTRTNGGFGAGGGAATSAAGAGLGGNAYAVITFQPEI